MSRSSSAARGESGTPMSVSEGDLQHFTPGPVQFMLQSIGEMRESIGALKQAVDTLTVQSKEQAKKLDTLSHRMYAAGAVLAVLTAVLAWIMNNLASVARALESLASTPR